MSASAIAQPIARSARPTAERIAHTVDRQGIRLFLAGGVFAAGIVGGMYLGSGPITAVFAFGAIGIAVVSPAIGLMVLAFMGPLQTPLVVPAPGSNFFIAGAIIMGSILRLPLERPRLRFHPAMLLLGAFVLFAFAQQIPEMASGYATDRAHIVGFMFFGLATGFATIVATGFVLRDRSPYPFLAALVASTLFAALLAIFTVDDLPLERLVNLLPPVTGDGRATGPFSNPNYFGQAMAYGAVLAISLATILRPRVMRLVLLAVSGILIYSILLSLSRGGSVAVLVGVIALAFTRSRTTGVVALVVGGLIAAVGYPALVEWRLTTLIGDAATGAQLNLADSDGGRLDAILAGPALFALSPVFGVGFGQYRFVAPQVTEGNVSLVAHNWYGTVLAEQGLVGVFLWSLMLIAVIRWIATRPWAPRRAGFAMLAATCAGSLFTMPPQHFQTGVVPAIVLTAALVANWSRERVTALDEQDAKSGTALSGWQRADNRPLGAGS